MAFYVTHTGKNQFTAFPLRWKSVSWKLDGTQRRTEREGWPDFRGEVRAFPWKACLHLEWDVSPAVKDRKQGERFFTFLLEFFFPCGEGAWCWWPGSPGGCKACHGAGSLAKASLPACRVPETPWSSSWTSSPCPRWPCCPVWTSTSWRTTLTTNPCTCTKTSRSCSHGGWHAAPLPAQKE